MYHFIYKTISKSGKYYIGRHSTTNLDDGYFGSGKWIRSLKDKSDLKREIIEYCSEDSLKEREQYYLTENVGKQDCMNFNLSPVGFSTGKLNPAHSPEEKKRRSESFKGENNPAKWEDVRRKMSQAQKGRVSPMKGKKMSEQGRKNISEARKGLKFSEEGKKKLSESRKKQYEEGKRGIPSFKGMKHSEETLKRMSETHKNRPRLECAACGGIFAVNTHARFHGDKCKSLNK